MANFLCPSCMDECFEPLRECAMDHHALGCSKCIVRTTCDICSHWSLALCEFCRRSDDPSTVQDIVQNRPKYPTNSFNDLDSSVEQDDAFLILKKHTQKSNLAFRKCNICGTTVCSSCSYACSGDHSTLQNDAHVICVVCTTEKPGWHNCDVCDSTRETCGYCRGSGKQLETTCDVCYTERCEDCVFETDSSDRLQFCESCRSKMCKGCTSYQCYGKFNLPHALCVLCPEKPLQPLQCDQCHSEDEICTFCARKSSSQFWIFSCEECNISECLKCEDASLEEFCDAKCLLCGEHRSRCIHKITNLGPNQCRGCAACHWLCEVCSNSSGMRYLKSCIGCEPFGVCETLLFLCFDGVLLPEEIVQIIYCYIFVTKMSPMTPASKLYYKYT